MIVTAALPWWDETPEDLDRFVRALPVAADRLVAADGGYKRYPNAAARSPRSQTAAIRAAARAVGLPVEIITPDRVWAGQVEKRTALYRAAAEGSDWILTLDADHILHGVREPIRHEIDALVVEDRVEVPFYTTPNYERPLAETAATDWHASMSGTTTTIGLFLRALPDIRLEKHHWWSSAMKGTRRVWLYGGDGSYPMARAHVLQAPLLVEHRCLYRRDRNILAGRAFAEDRVLLLASTGHEDDLETAEAAA